MFAAVIVFFRNPDSDPSLLSTFPAKYLQKYFAEHVALFSGLGLFSLMNARKNP
jgi:hypothetical protein